jgi:hypothetical protein
MNIKKISSCNGYVYQVTLTEFEKNVFLSMCNVSSIPEIVKHFKANAPPNREFYPDNESVGKTLIRFVLQSS